MPASVPSALQAVLSDSKAERLVCYLFDLLYLDWD
jgi:hypothetical protein